MRYNNARTGSRGEFGPGGTAVEERHSGRVPLLATKLFIPRARQELVARPHLIERLNAGLRCPLTLISAPAGFGKTTLAGAWARAVDLPVAWLSLEETDNDPVRFLRYLVAALQGIDASIGREIQGALEASPRLDLVIDAIINELAARPGDFVLVLDDLHVVEEASIYEALRALVAHQPPGMHLVIVTREDPPLPLARLRARGQLVELRAHDLRFAPGETAVFLNEVMGLALGARDVEELNARTEGWIAGLQLAGLSVRDRADSATFIARLSGSHRNILNYLTEEVLGRQPEEIRRFLLQTSILDKLNGDLCDAVTGRAGSSALLERLLGANLFLIPLDDERQWYRYYHLFAGMLRNLLHALHKDEVAELHRRAGAWYARAGLAGEAIGHALAAADYATALRLLEGHATDMVMQGYLQTVTGWLNAIPPELRAQSPRTNMAFVWMHLVRGKFALAAPYLVQLQVVFSGARPDAAEDPAVKAEWLALQSSLMVMQGQPAMGLELARQALDIAPEEDAGVRSMACNGMACAYLMLGQYDRAVEVYQQAILHSRASAHLVWEILIVSTLAMMSIHHGRLRFACDAVTQAIDRLERAGSMPPMSAVACGALGQVYYHRNELERARPLFLRAIQICSLGGYADGEIYHRALLSRLLQMEGDLETSGREIAKALDLSRSGVPDWINQEAVCQQVRLDLAGKRTAAAVAALGGQGFSFQGGFAFPVVAPDRTIPASFEETLTHEIGSLHNTALHVLLARDEEKHDAESLELGIELAGRIIAGALKSQYHLVALEALLLRARLHAALGDGRAARADCARAVELAEPEGFVCLFLEAGSAIAGLLASLRKHDGPGYVETLLAAFAGASPEPPESPAAPLEPGEPAALVEPLTRRELEILRLIGEGCSNAEIAARLVLSPHTVKKHTGNIFAKLDATSRTQAVARARRLRLL